MANIKPRSRLSRVDHSKPPSENAKLTQMQRVFVEGVAAGMTDRAAARAAGFANPDVQAVDLKRKPKIQKALAEAKAAYAIASGMTKKKVIDGFLEAIDIARVKADPLTMVAGWREVGKMCGFYEPTKTKLEISVKGQVLLEKMSAMSDEELLQLTHEHEGEFEVIDEQSST